MSEVIQSLCGKDYDLYTFSKSVPAYDREMKADVSLLYDLYVYYRFVSDNRSFESEQKSFELWLKEPSEENAKAIALTEFCNEIWSEHWVTVFCKKDCQCTDTCSNTEFDWSCWSDDDLEFFDRSDWSPSTSELECSGSVDKPGEPGPFPV